MATAIARSEYIIPDDPGYVANGSRATKMDGSSSSVKDSESFRSVRLVQRIARPSVVDFHRTPRTADEVRYILRTGKTPSEVAEEEQGGAAAAAPKLRFGDAMHHPPADAYLTPNDSVSRYGRAPAPQPPMAPPQQMPMAPPQQMPMAPPPQQQYPTPQQMPMAPPPQQQYPTPQQPPMAPQYYAMPPPQQDFDMPDPSDSETYSDMSFGSQGPAEDDPAMNIYGGAPPMPPGMPPPMPDAPPGAPVAGMPPSVAGMPAGVPPLPPGAHPMPAGVPPPVAGVPAAAPAQPLVSPFDEDQLAIQEDDESRKSGYLTEIYDLRSSLKLPPTNLDASNTLSTLRSEYDMLHRMHSTRHYTNIGMAGVLILLSCIEKAGTSLGMDRFVGFRDVAIRDPSYEAAVRRFVRSNFAYRGVTNPLQDMAMMAGMHAIMCGTVGKGAIAAQIGTGGANSGQIMGSATASSVALMADSGQEPMPRAAGDVAAGGGGAAAAAMPMPGGASNPMAAMMGQMGGMGNIMEMMKDPGMQDMLQQFMSQPGAMDTITSVMSGGMPQNVAVPPSPPATANTRSQVRMSGPE